MTNPIRHPYLDLCSTCCQAFADLVRTQWTCLDAQWQLGIRALESLRGSAGTRPAASQTGDASELEARAEERTRRGLAPPPDVYQVQNRNRIDWSRFPEWARPSDPELFEGHEG
jgi:hypothetical protein